MDGTMDPSTQSWSSTPPTLPSTFHTRLFAENSHQRTSCKHAFFHSNPPGFASSLHKQPVPRS